MSPLIDRLTGINAVREALQAGSAIDRVVIARGRQDTRTEIVQLARGRGIPVRFEDRGQIDRLANTKDHQGVVALAAARAAGSLEDILANAKAGGHGGLIVLLDGVEDPHNLGAIIRTALAVARKVSAGTIAASPSLRSDASAARCRAAVPELQATACVAPVAAAKAASNFSTSGPVVRKSDFSAAATAAMSSSSTVCRA